MTNDIPQPLVNWTAGESPETVPDVVWFATMDNHKYQIEVHRAGSYTGRLLMWDVSGFRVDLDPPPPWPVVLDEEVPLSYQALFGPDIDDVASWQAKCAEIADARMEKEGS